MIWQNWHDFFAMGGYATYVWGSCIVVFGCMVGEVLFLKQRDKTIHQRLANTHRSTPSSRDFV